MSERVKLHLGCGPVDFGKGWLQIDQKEWPHACKGDVSRLPIYGGGADLIYASHVLEYFDWTEVLDVLRSWNEALKPGGKLMVAVPDFEALSMLYREGNAALTQLLGPLYGKMGDPPIYHKMAYDYSTLHQVLRMADFHRADRVGKYSWVWHANVDSEKINDGSLAHIGGVGVSLNVIAYKRQ